MSAHRQRIKVYAEPKKKKQDPEARFDREALENFPVKAPPPFLFPETDGQEKEEEKPKLNEQYRYGRPVARFALIGLDADSEGWGNWEEKEKEGEESEGEMTAEVGEMEMENSEDVMANVADTEQSQAAILETTETSTTGPDLSVETADKAERQERRAAAETERADDGEDEDKPKDKKKKEKGGGKIHKKPKKKSKDGFFSALPDSALTRMPEHAPPPLPLIEYEAEALESAASPEIPTHHPPSIPLIWLPQKAVAKLPPEALILYPPGGRLLVDATHLPDFPNASRPDPTTTQNLLQLHRAGTHDALTDFHQAAQDHIHPLHADHAAMEIQLRAQAETHRNLLFSAFRDEQSRLALHLDEVRAKAFLEAQATRQAILKNAREALDSAEARHAHQQKEMDGEFRHFMRHLRRAETQSLRAVRAMVRASVRDTLAIGEQKAAEAMAQAEQRADEYASESLPDMDWWDYIILGPDYYELQREARVDAALEVGEGYSAEFIVSARDTADGVAEMEGEALETVQTSVEDAEKVAEQQHKVSEGQLEAAHKQAEDGIKRMERTSLDLLRDQWDTQQVRFDDLETEGQVNLSETYVAADSQLAEWISA
ncbi:MAG: hypothetical protein AAF570_12165, partial [Bacteroidota bacterium]